MTYTTQGYMTAADLADHAALTDTGLTTFYGDDLPDFLPADAPCTNCGRPYGAHDSVRVVNADGEPVSCTFL